MCSGTEGTIQVMITETEKQKMGQTQQKIRVFLLRTRKDRNGPTSP